MKYLVIIGDGMTGWASDSVEGKTALELADTPYLDLLAKKGELGLANNTPDSLPPGSDVCNLSLFGYNPEEYYAGRAPIEAVSQGIELADDETIFRANLVKIEDGKMKDFTAGHIPGSDGKRCISSLNKMLSNNNMKFFPGVSYRNLFKIKENYSDLITTPPHDIIGKEINEYLPKGKGAGLLKDIMFRSSDLLPQDTKANMVWLWGEGKKMNLPTFQSKYKLKGAVITAVDLIKGLGLSAGMDFISVPGVTGFIDTNYEGKAQYAINALDEYDIVFIHVEAPDEAGHTGDLKLKIRAIEDFDSKVIATILKNIGDIDYKMLVLPDHPTPIAIRTHARDSVPFIIYNSKNELNNKVAVYTEIYVKEHIKEVIIGHNLMNRFLS